MIDLDGLHSHTWGADACSGTRFISVNSTGKWSWLLPRRFYMYCFTRPPEGSLSLQTGVSTRRLTGWGGLGTWVGPPRPQTVTAWIKSLSCNISVTNKISLWLLNFGPDADLNTRSDVPAFISANTGVTCKESPEPDRGEVVHLCWVVCRTLWWIVGNAA